MFPLKSLKWIVPSGATATDGIAAIFGVGYDHKSVGADGPYEIDTPVFAAPPWNEGHPSLIGPGTLVGVAVAVG